MPTLHRRQWLKQSSLLFAGFGLYSPFRLQAAESYQSPPAENLVRLTSNENPYGPSPLARKAMAEAVATSNRYPWDRTNQLREKIGNRHGLNGDYVLLGAGSSEILGLVTLLASRDKGSAITAAPSFSSWVPTAERLGLTITRVPLTGEKKCSLEGMLSKITATTRLFYICNPNNPTGTILPASAIKEATLQASKQSYVLVDEAYLEYTDEPSLSALVKENRNIIVAKTFSKIYGLAGARIGYALAHPDTIDKLSTLQPWPNAGISAVSLAGALASLDDTSFVEKTRQWNSEARTFTQTELSSTGFTVIPSHTNFLYYSLNNFSGDWSGRLREKNILAGGVTEAAGKWTRITVGSMDEMKQFARAVKAIV